MDETNDAGSQALPFTNERTGAGYDSLVKAVVSAVAGDTLRVQAGTYTVDESIALAANMILRGEFEAKPGYTAILMNNTIFPGPDGERGIG